MNLSERAASGFSQLGERCTTDSLPEYSHPLPAEIDPQSNHLTSFLGRLLKGQQVHEIKRHAELLHRMSERLSRNLLLKRIPGFVEPAHVDKCQRLDRVV